MMRVKLIRGNDEDTFELLVNKFFETHRVVSVEYRSASYKYQGDEDIFVEYIAFITYEVHN